ncbi:MAG: hypothetical protein ACYCSZ_07940 [Burkholderiales bacterium]
MPPCDNASRRALESDFPLALATGPPAAAGAAVNGRAVSVEAFGADAVVVTDPPAGRAGADGLVPSAVRPFRDSALRLSSAAARAERGAAVLFAIASLMLLSFGIHSILAPTVLAARSRSMLWISCYSHLLPTAYCHLAQADMPIRF